MTELGASPRFRAVVVIPIYNHAATISHLLSAVRHSGLRCILVDDGSDAACAALLNHLALRNWPALTLIRLRENQGKGAAVTAGAREAARQGYSHMLQIDADGQHDVSDIGHFVALARREPDAIVCGDPRFDASAPVFRRLGRWLTHVCVWMETLSFDVHDAMCGYRVYPLGVTLGLMDDQPLASRMAFDIEVLVHLHWRGVRVVNLSTAVTYPAGGVSHFHGVLDNALIAWTHTKLLAGMPRRLPALMRRKFKTPKARR